MLSPMQPDRIELVRRQFANTNDAFEQHNAIFRNISERMQARLDLLAIEPTRVLDLGCRNGYQLEALQERFPKAQIIGTDPAGTTETPKSRWWQRRRKGHSVIPSDPHCLPFATESFDLVLSNMLLPWCYDPAVVFGEVARVLTNNGAFMFTSAGPDTLQEYVELWRHVDLAQHSFGLVDMHKIGDELLSAGFAAPVLDREEIIVDYASLDALQDELRKVGAANLAIGRRNALMATSVRKLLAKSVAAGRFSVTLELVQGHGWKGDLSPGKRNSSEEFTVSLDSLRQSLRGSE